jgi:hypothetical protein
VVTFTPDADFGGDASFDYTISDGQGGIAEARVDIDVILSGEPVSHTLNAQVFGTVRDTAHNSPLGTPDFVFDYYSNHFDEFNDTVTVDRGIMEFNASNIEPSATSATFNGDVQSVSGSFPQDMYIYLYSGNGTVTLDDFNAGVLAGTAHVGDFGQISVSLDTAVLNDVLEAGDWVGANFRVAEDIGSGVITGVITPPPTVSLEIVTDSDVLLT